MVKTSRCDVRMAQRGVPTVLHIDRAFAISPAERERRSMRHLLHSAVPARGQLDGSRQSVQLHSLEYETENATATKRARPRALAQACSLLLPYARRSEERRVGKECRSRW